MLGYIPFNGKKMPLPRYFEKLAHKHWCYYNDQSYFEDNDERKAPYTLGGLLPNGREIAALYEVYLTNKKEKLKNLEEEWNETISHYLETKETPEFKKAAENALYDLKNKETTENF